MGNCFLSNNIDINEYDYGGFNYEKDILKSNLKNSILFSKNPFHICLAYVQKNSPSNILSNNILILDSHYYVKLVSFTYSDSTIHYIFENNVELKIMRTQDSNIIYYFRHRNINMTLELDLYFNIYEKYFVCVNNKGNTEFDKLLEFIRKDKLNNITTPCAKEAEYLDAVNINIYSPKEKTHSSGVILASM